jgi:hypothetical protein
VCGVEEVHGEERTPPPGPGYPDPR